jgi:hypothetical protein
MGLKTLGSPAQPFWTGIRETGPGAVSIMEVTDVSGDGVADVVLCRLEGGTARVEAAVQTEMGWRLESQPARPDCVESAVQ